MCYAGKWTQNEEKSIFYPHFFSNNKKNSVFLPNKFRIWHIHKLNFSLSFKVTWLTAISKRFLCCHVSHWLVLSTWRAGRCPFPSSWALKEKYKRWLVNLWMCVWNIKSILLPHGHHMMLGCRIHNLIRLYSISILWAGILSFYYTHWKVISDILTPKVRNILQFPNQLNLKPFYIHFFLGHLYTHISLPSWFGHHHSWIGSVSL